MHKNVLLIKGYFSLKTALATTCTIRFPFGGTCSLVEVGFIEAVLLSSAGVELKFYYQKVVM